MQMVYNSENYVVVHFEGEGEGQASADTQVPGHADAPAPVARRTAGFEIVDKLGRADIFLHGALAERFQHGAQALMQQWQGQPDAEVLDAYIAGFAALGRQPLSLH